MSYAPLSEVYYSYPVSRKECVEQNEPILHEQVQSIDINAEQRNQCKQQITAIAELAVFFGIGMAIIYVAHKRAGS